MEIKTELYLGDSAEKLVELNSAVNGPKNKK